MANYSSYTAAAYPLPYAYLPTSAPAVGAPPPPPATTTSSAMPWVEHTSHDGRNYYYNTVTQQTTWEKPIELKSTRELILSQCPWKEFKSDNGKIYYYNEQTKQSVWVKPQELLDAESQVESMVGPGGGGPTSDSVDALSSIVPVTPCTPATPSDVPTTTTTTTNPPEPSAIEKAMLATLATYDSTPSAETIPVPTIPPPPPPPTTTTSSDEANVSQDVEQQQQQQQQQQQTPSSTSPPIQEYKTRGEMAEGLRRLFRDCNVPGGSTWEQALKLISSDRRYALLRTFNEKKQIFNVYKTQKLKEEREEQRVRAKKARENLEQFLIKHPDLHSTMSYRKVDQVLASAREWTVVPDRERRELFDDVMQLISKREREEAKVLRKRNIKVFTEILSHMSSLTCRATWSEAQQMLLDNKSFTGDVQLQSLDKEDALVCFEEHICMLEQEHDEEKERERRKQKRLQRKNREAFIVLLNELHEHNMLSSTSLWKDLYPVISRDDRFDKMLAQRGSTPLDLFKFYVEALKARYPAERKLIKEIVKDRGFFIDLGTTFDDFATFVAQDERSKGVDEGNLRMAFETLIEKAQGRERERQREDARRQRKLEQNFCELLRSGDFVGPETTWEQVRDNFKDQPAFCALSLESDRIRVFKEYLISLEAASIDGEKSRKSRKDKNRAKNELVEIESSKRDKAKKRAMSTSPVPSEATGSGHSGSDEHESFSKRKHRKSKKSKRKKSKHHKHHKSSRRAAGGDEELEEGEAADDDEDETESRAKHRAHRKRRRRARSSDPEDGEEIDSDSGEENFDRDSKRKRH